MAILFANVQYYNYIDVTIELFRSGSLVNDRCTLNEPNIAQYTTKVVFFIKGLLQMKY